ncbi:MAG: cell division protein SepF [Firmicutes bacterium]|nr:cell division protein SepF [Bacillota bacterium]
MGFSDTFKKLIGIEDIEEGIEQEEIEEAKKSLVREERESIRRPQPEFKSPVASAEAQKVVPVERRISVAGTSAFKLVVIEPKSFDECPKLVDSLKGRRPVIINLEKIETETAKKIFDFLSGATYALNGNVQKVANNIFIFAPESVDIAASQDERGFDFGGNKNPWR